MSDLIFRSTATAFKQNRRVMDTPTGGDTTRRWCLVLHFDDMRCSTRTSLKDARRNRKCIYSQCVWVAPSSWDKFAMSAKLNALNSDSYTDVSQYRDQHFKVSSSDLYKVAAYSKETPHTLFVIVTLLCFFRSTTVSNRQSLHFARFKSVGIHSFHFNIQLGIT